MEQEKRDVYIGKVQYVDYFDDSEIQKDIDLIRPFINKGKSYKYEEEVRAVIDFFPFKLKDGVLKPMRITKGYRAAINPDLLIEKVVMSPLSPKWKKKLVESVLSKFGLTKEVRRTDLDKTPLH